MDLKYQLMEYKKLLNCKSLGFYNCCEKVSVFLTDKSNASTYNIYTIFVFEERIEPIFISEYMTDSLITISDKFSVGISHSVQNIESIEEIFKAIGQSQGKGYVDIGEGKLCIGELEYVPKSFVQQDSTKEILLNKILKNNFRNGSYILEFFDVEKKCLCFLSKSQLKKIYDELYKIIPIDLFTISDRFGNFVFQFPSINTTVTYKTNKEETILAYNISFDERLKEYKQYQLISELMYDNNTIGFGTEECQAAENKITVMVGDSSKMCTTTLMDTNEQLILCRQDTNFIRTASLDIHIGSEFGEQRLIFDMYNALKAAIDVTPVHQLDIGEPVVRLREKYIDERSYTKRLDEMMQRGEFRRYGMNAKRERAIKDIRELMDLSDSGRVCLWDPYLCVEDILETWYYTKTLSIPFYAITSSKAAEKSGLSVSEWIQSERHIIDTRSNNYGIRMEFRCRCNGHGYAFHDRFLMVINKDAKPRVWSLGTSINSLGKSHHIIQEVLHPQMIVDAFDELWDMLSYDECLIWKKD